MHDAPGFLHDFHDGAIPQPAGVKGLAAALGVENGRLQYHCKLLFMGRALQHIDIGNQVVVGKNRRWVMVYIRIRVLPGSINSAQMSDNPFKYQWTCAS